MDASDRYHVEQMIEEKTRYKVSVSHRINQCGVCGSDAQKICWSCHNDTIEELQKQINVLKRQVKVLLELNGKKVEA